MAAKRDRSVVEIVHVDSEQTHSRPKRANSGKKRRFDEEDDDIVVVTPSKTDAEEVEVEEEEEDEKVAHELFLGIVSQSPEQRSIACAGRSMMANRL